MALVQMRLGIPEDYYRWICATAREQGIKEAEVLRRAVDLYAIARQHKESGMKIGAAREGQVFAAEISGI
jgi:hypothetical protein